MYVVYWIETWPRYSADRQLAWYEMTGEMWDLSLTQDTPHYQQFDTSELTKALAFTETLRQRRKAGQKISFITMCSEHPDSVGEPGVSDKLPEGYDWTKQDRAGKMRR